MIIGLEAVVAAGVLVSFIVFWSYTIFYKFFTKKENDVKKLSEKEIDNLVNNYQKIKKREGRDYFANKILDVMEFSHIVEDGKKGFEKGVLFSGLILILLTVCYVIYQNTENANLFLALLVISAIYLLHKFYDLNNKKGYVERYLKGEDPDKILKEIEGNAD